MFLASYKNQATYHFHYDVMNRLIAEVGFDNRKTTYHYNKRGELIEKQEFSPSNDTQVLRFTEFQHDELGRQVSQTVKTSGEMSQTHYQYDELNRLTQLSDGQNTLLFRYDKVGRLIEQRQWQMNDSGFANSQVISYQYDKNGNRTKLTLPNKDEIRYFYYGSGHLSAIKYNDSLITEISRDKLHQEISRSQGALTSQFKHDALGRLTQQLATLESASKRATINEHIVRRNYQYDRVGNLTEIEDLRIGKTPYRYDKLGQIQLAGQELFHFDPAHNLIEKETQRIENNQLTEYQGNHYRYDEFGNLSERRLANGEIQTYRYNVKDQLIKAIIQKPNQVKEEWQYQYDVLGRRIGKVRLENGEILAESQVEFIWDGSHLVQEIEHKTDRTFTYIYSHPNSYEPLVQLAFAKGNEKPTACYYYHNDQIGIPRELTDEQGKLCWYGNYTGWGKLKNEYILLENIHQPFRLQNQYADEETGLHYNFFRYYEPNIGRFTQLDPIGLAGGSNLYAFAPNVQQWIDIYGLSTEASKILPSNWENSYSKSVAMTEVMSRAKLSPKKTQTYEVSLPIPKRSIAAGAGITSELQQCVYFTVCDTVHSVGNSPKFTIALSTANSAMQTGESEANCTTITSPGINIKKVPVSATISGCSSPDGSRSTSKGLSLGAQKGGIEVSQCRTVSRCSPAVKF